MPPPTQKAEMKHAFQPKGKIIGPTLSPSFRSRFTQINTPNITAVDANVVNVDDTANVQHSEVVVAPPVIDAVAVAVAGLKKCLLWLFNHHQQHQHHHQYKSRLKI